MRGQKGGISLGFREITQITSQSASQSDFNMAEAHVDVTSSVRGLRERLALSVRDLTALQAEMSSLQAAFTEIEVCSRQLLDMGRSGKG